MSLEDVDFTDYAYPCAAYALRRTGHSSARPGYPLPDYFERIAYSADSLQEGDIVAWEVEDQETDAALLMNKGKPVTVRIKFRVHFGAYEGDGLVSDVSYSGDSIPYVRLREIAKITEPRWIYRVR